ncbi:putative tetrahydrofolylpolyglutamate synthase [Aspergillus piperis CBS 112811]|uniref:Folylpolyglutamate synthase n=1 Tax=Aspergillus piperis CBS 112811 TaxID=1448313 RepID=A0A8G1VIL5_9EURO|nr:putative tetrahydrofolylpolyglutamate synthase [Aspergillus piperis CBS 112811]RAH53377.1 putative tetrahydrofolylpolyglutamate synthase [Aspergillus piperis CBS 112811]
MKRNYENALKLLETRRRKARPTTPAATFQQQTAAPPSNTPTVRGVPSLNGMKEWLQMLGHTESDLNNLNIIHVAGTKGKGSTCAFARSLLRAHGLRTGFPSRVGLYTSPDLQCIRERIQIDDRPITEEIFARYFFEVWDRIITQNPSKDKEGARLPRYLQLLAILAFHTFIRENVDAAIFETHHGGEYDATNVVQNPVVTGITSLGMDHVAQLGPTLEDIAWHKAGILKTGVPAFSLEQEAVPARMLRNRAAEKRTHLEFVTVNTSLPDNSKVLGVPVQRLNCSLAVELVRTFVQVKAPGHELNAEDISRAVDSFSWGGRFQIIEKGFCHWFLDGAHNTLSLEQAAAWFSENTRTVNCRRCRVLIFSHFSEERDGRVLVECLGRALLEQGAKPEHVIFTTYNERDDGTSRLDKTLKVPEKPFPDLCSVYTAIWSRLDPEAVVSSRPTIESAIRLAEQIAARCGGAQCFVTGSLHLVGGALNLLES